MGPLQLGMSSYLPLCVPHFDSSSSKLTCANPILGILFALLTSANLQYRSRHLSRHSEDSLCRYWGLEVPPERPSRTHGRRRVVWAQERQRILRVSGLTQVCLSPIPCVIPFGRVLALFKKPRASLIIYILSKSGSTHNTTCHLLFPHSLK